MQNQDGGWPAKQPQVDSTAYATCRCECNGSRRTVVSKLPPQALIAANPELMTASLGAEEIVILHLKTGRYYSLSAVGAEVWKLLLAPRRMSEIVHAIVTAYAVETAQCEADIQALLDDMAREQLIAIQRERVQ